MPDNTKIYGFRASDTRYMYGVRDDTCTPETTDSTSCTQRILIPFTLKTIFILMCNLFQVDALKLELLIISVQ